MNVIQSQLLKVFRLASQGLRAPNSAKNLRCHEELVARLRAAATDGFFPTPFDQTGSSFTLSCSRSQESDRAFACSLSAAAVFQLNRARISAGASV